jgi:hypothetical protein
MPAEAELKVKKGSRVQGGSSVLAELPETNGQKKAAADAVVA